MTGAGISRTCWRIAAARPAVVGTPMSLTSGETVGLPQRHLLGRPALSPLRDVDQACDLAPCLVTGLRLADRPRPPARWR